MLRSAALRNVHDVMLALGLGANGVCPYVMVEVICVEDYEKDVSNLCAALTKGIEKVISTIGIHEVRGYARQFSSIGVKPELAEIFQTKAFAATEKGGTGFAELDADTNERAKALSGDDASAKPAKTFRFYPKVYKFAIATANGTGTYEEYSEKVRDLEKQSPISMRHIMALKGDRPAVDPSEVDAGVGHHDYPIVISSMSFGSQSEPAFRAYADAAKAINILCMNGEGGEIRDMYGQYRNWRGQQIASGRFGVSAEMVNSSYVAEIKIGQGAKPGEGGHLPGKKVSEKVAAAARNAAPGTDLISPSNNHDLYSIEDLAELIDELKTVNPDVRVSVKVPVVPNIGTIGLGIAKAGADIITLSGFEGGTGAARQHALRHVGLPSDIGTRAVHQALMEAGLRNRVEIWADGGYRTGHDIVKLHCLGANRVGFGTLAMVSLGCTICRGCQLDTCHVGIATQIETSEQAAEHGLKKFTPQEVERSAESAARFFSSMGEEVKEVVASLGYTRAQDLVGRYDLLEQVAMEDEIDLTPLISPLEEYLDLEPLDLPVAEEFQDTRAEAGLITARPIRMEAKSASAEDRQAGAGNLWRPDPPQRVPAGHRRQRPGARDRALRGDRPLEDLRRRPRVLGRDPRQPRVQRRFGRPRAGRVQLLRGRAAGRGRRPGRRRQGDAGRQDRDPQGQGGERQAAERLGREVLRLRRPARQALRPGLGRLALLHPVVRGRRGARR